MRLESQVDGQTIFNRKLLPVITVRNREIKIHVYGIRQTANVSWKFLRIENCLLYTSDAADE